MQLTVFLSHYEIFAMKKLHQAFCIDLTASRPEIMEYDVEIQKEDMAYLGVSSFDDLSDEDRRAFRTIGEAESFLLDYELVKKTLDNRVICQDRNLPAMLLKRRSIILAILGLKKSTMRSYRKPWKAGQRFNFHDQTYFLTVRLKSISETNDGFRYDFEII